MIHLEELSKEQILDILKYIGVSTIRNEDSTRDNIQFCCPVHGESNPSMGYSFSKGVCHCFSCHFTGDIVRLIFKSTNDFKNEKEVEEWIQDRYNVDLSYKSEGIFIDLKRYEDFDFEEFPEEVHSNKPIDRAYLAPYKSGKETYSYILKRGFTKKTIKDFMIGKDSINKTVTIPIFSESNELYGFIGRYIDPNRPKNARYKIYNVFTKEILFPLDKGEPIDDTIILVEGILDSIWCHQNGITNAKALLSNKVTREQAIWLKDHCSTIIDMTDNDKMGEYASSSIKTRLKGMKIYTVKHKYPEDKKDPCDCTKEELYNMIQNKKSIYFSGVRRIR